MIGPNATTGSSPRSEPWHRRSLASARGQRSLVFSYPNRCWMDDHQVPSSLCVRSVCISRRPSANQHDEDLRADDAVDDPVRPHHDLPKLPDSKRSKLTRMTATVREGTEALADFKQPLEHTIRSALALCFGDVVVDRCKIVLCPNGEQDSMGHQSPAFQLARSRSTTSFTGAAFPCSISRFPSASSFSKASTS